MAHDPWTGGHEPHRLRRSSRDRMWAGVAGGMAEYFDVDPTLMRLIWVVATVVTAGLLVAVYLVMWVIMPLNSEIPPDSWDPPQPDAEPMGVGSMAADAGPIPPPQWSRREYRQYVRHGYPGRRRRSGGFVLIALGLLFLGAQSGIFRWINWSVAWALVLIVLGAALLLRNHDWRL